MDQRHTSNALREMLREQICCLGRIVARHRVPDDVVWEIAKGFDVIYQRARRQVETSPSKTEIPLGPHRMEPHPGLTYLLEKLEVETFAPSGDTGRR